MSNGSKKHDHKNGHADWQVVHADGGRTTISGARVSRDQHGGYTFTDGKGVKADFAPGTVRRVQRIDPEQASGDQPDA